jgi:Tfp pilus assembly protein PilN
MLQFNLLPDVKKEYIKAKRQKRLVITVSVITGVTSLVLLFLLFSYVQFAQKKSIDDLTEDISTEVAKVNSVQGLNEILTIQNQLKSIPGVVEEKPETSRIFDYIRLVTPTNVFISSLELDVINNTIEVSGSASDLVAINTFADTLKFATYKTKDIEDGKPFSNVITDLTRNSEKSSYLIEMQFDPILFDNKVDVALIVPKTVTTRSVTGQPDIEGNQNEALFIDEQNPEEIQ